MLQPTDLVDCPKCKGQGRIAHTCGRCGGSGYRQQTDLSRGLHASTTVRCYKCDGKGKLYEGCDECAGTGRDTRARAEVWLAKNKAPGWLQKMFFFIALVLFAIAMVLTCLMVGAIVYYKYIAPRLTIAPVSTTQVPTPEASTPLPTQVTIPVRAEVPQTTFNITFTIERVDFTEDSLIFHISIFRKPSAEALVWTQDLHPYDGIYLETSNGQVRAAGVGGVFAAEQTLMEDNGTYRGWISFPRILDKQVALHYPGMGTASISLK